MSAGGLLARRFAADYTRNGVNALVLVLVPGTFVVVAAGSLGDAATRLGGNAAAVATVTAGWAAGFVSAVGMYFLVAGNRQPDRRLLISGLPRRTLVLARSATGLLVAAVSAAAALAALALRSGIDSPGRAVLGTIMFALVYAAVGALMAVLLPDPVNGVIAVLFVWILDVFFGPALTGSARAGTRFLPTHYLSLWMTGQSPGHEVLGTELAWAVGWTVVAIAAAAWLLSLSGRRPQRWLRHRRAVQSTASPATPSATGRTGAALPRRVRTIPPTAAALTASVRDWARVRVLWLLLVLVPAVFVLLSDAITPPGRMAVTAVDAGRTVTVMVDPADLHAGTMAVSGIAALAMLSGAFVVLDSRHADRRLTQAGLPRRSVITARMSTAVLAAAIATAASLLMTALVFTPANWWAYGLASVLVAVTYAFAGMIVAPLVGRVAAILLAFLIPFLDLGLSQSPMLRAEPEAWAQALPGDGGMRLLIDASVTPGLDQWGSLASSLAWLGVAAVGAAAVVAMSASRSARMTDLSS
ncbi:MAG: ABC transporter permease [Mycobacterium sp.]|jgi:hypothetical protein